MIALPGERFEQKGVFFKRKKKKKKKKKKKRTIVTWAFFSYSGHGGSLFD
jgi:hypothetical protein